MTGLRPCANTKSGLRWGPVSLQDLSRPAPTQSTADPTPEIHRIKLMDSELRIVWAEVYVPDFPDTQGHAMSQEEIRKMAHQFLSDGRTRRVNVGHGCEHDVSEQCDCGLGSTVVESFVAREDDPLFIPGSWVAGIHVPDDSLWEKVKNGDLNGFSMEAFTLKEENSTIEIEIPDDGIVIGETGLSNPGNTHYHGIEVQFDARGEFVGGHTTFTSAGPAHVHRLSRMTATDKHGDHSHRYSLLDALRRAANEKSL